MRAGVKAGLRGAGALVVLVLLAVGVLVWQPLWVADQVVRWHLWRQHVQSRYVEVDGYRVHYFEARPSGLYRRQERPLVLVHGLGARGEDWASLIPTLAARGFHVYAPDLLGYGRTVKPDVDYSIALQEKTVVDFMGAVGVPRADVAGWSMGGWVAMKMAVEHPAAVDRLVLLDAAGVYFPATFDASLFLPNDQVGVARLMGMLSPEPRPLPAFVGRAALRKLRANAWVLGRSLNAMQSGRDLLDFRLQQVQQPTLIIWGKQDTLIPLAAGKVMHRQIAGSSLLVVEGCGHLAPAECSAPVLRGMVEFLWAEPAMKGVESEVPGR